MIWEQHPERDRYKREVFQKYFDRAIDSRGAFAIIEESSGRFIGGSEIGWTFLERRFWGGRYNGELKKLMIDHAFRFVERIVFIVGQNNTRSQKALEKIGAKFAGQSQRPGNVIFEIVRRSSSV